MFGTFREWFFEFSLGSFGTLRKIFDVKIFKRLAAAPTIFIQFQTNFRVLRGNTGHYFFWRSAKFLSIYVTLRRRYLSYITIIHKGILVSYGKRSSRGSRSLGLFRFSTTWKLVFESIWKRLVVEQNGLKFGIRRYLVYMRYIFSYLTVTISKLIWGHWVHFRNFRFSATLYFENSWS